MLDGFDAPPGQSAGPQTAVSINHTVPDVPTGQALPTKLSDGDAVTMPFGPVFFSPEFDMVRDLFGTHWMIGVPSQVRGEG